MIEEWKPIEGYEGLYEVSNLGRIKSFQKGRNFIIKPGKLKYYSRVNLFNKKINKNMSIHRIVAIHFIPNPNNLPLVCHKIETLDENGLLYNGEDNLYWGTHSDNAKDKFKKGRANNHFQTNHPSKGKFGKDHHRSIPVLQYDLEGNFIKEYFGILEGSRELGVKDSEISKVCKGKRKTAGGFIWKYKI